MERNIQQALDDVGEIKRILGQTGRDLSNAARLFFLAGAVWAAEGLLQLAGTLLMTVQPAGGLPLLGTRVSAYLISLQAIHWGGWLAVLLVWLGLRRRQKELSRGLGLQLLDIWGCFLGGGTQTKRHAFQRVFLFEMPDQSGYLQPKRSGLLSGGAFAPYKRFRRR